MFRTIGIAIVLVMIPQPVKPGIVTHHLDEKCSLVLSGITAHSLEECYADESPQPLPQINQSHQPPYSFGPPPGYTIVVRGFK